jgi:hypothetical protein
MHQFLNKESSIHIIFKINIASMAYVKEKQYNFHEQCFISIKHRNLFRNISKKFYF